MSTPRCQMNDLWSLIQSTRASLPPLKLRYKSEKTRCWACRVWCCGKRTAKFVSQGTKNMRQWALEAMTRAAWKFQGCNFRSYPRKGGLINANYTSERSSFRGVGHSEVFMLSLNCCLWCWSWSWSFNKLCEVSESVNISETTLKQLWLVDEKSKEG